MAIYNNFTDSCYTIIETNLTKRRPSVSFKATDINRITNNNMNFNEIPTGYNGNNYYSQTGGQSLDTRLSAIMKRVYVKMFLGLLLTAFTAFFCVQSPAVVQFFAMHSWAMWVLFGVELVIVMSVSGGINRMNPALATLLFYLFAVVNGLMLFPIFFIYTGASIAKTFFICSGVFGAMSVYGYFTSHDLTKWGTYLIMALFGLIICAIVNIFLKSSTMEWIISGAGVLIFIGLTAWDTQQIKAILCRHQPKAQDE